MVVKGMIWVTLAEICYKARVWFGARITIVHSKELTDTIVAAPVTKVKPSRVCRGLVAEAADLLRLFSVDKLEARHFFLDVLVS